MFIYILSASDFHRLWRHSLCWVVLFLLRANAHAFIAHAGLSSATEWGIEKHSPHPLSIYCSKNKTKSISSIHQFYVIRLKRIFTCMAESFHAKTKHIKNSQRKSNYRLIYQRKILAKYIWALRALYRDKFQCLRLECPSVWGQPFPLLVH